MDVVIRDDDALRDATKKARQRFFFCLYLIPRFFVDITFLTKTTMTTKKKKDHDSCSSATHTSRRRRSQFRHPSSLYRQESLRINHAKKPCIQRRSNTADKGSHTSLGREDENEVDPGLGSDIEMRTIGPDRDRDQGPTEVCPSPTFSVNVYTYAA